MIRKRSSQRGSIAPIMAVGVLGIVLLSFVMAQNLRDCPVGNISYNLHAEAEWLYDQGHYRAAAECYQQILRHNPYDTMALNNLAWINVEYLNRDLRASLKMAQQAVELSWHTPEYQDTLGWAYFKLGQLERAVEPIRRAEKWDPCQPIYPAHLGAIYEAQGQRAESRAAYQRALTLDPACTEAQRGRKHRKRCCPPSPSVSIQVR